MRIPAFILLVAALAAPAAWADVTIVQKAKGPIAGDTELTMKVSGERARIDIGNQISSIVDLPAGRITSLMHSQKLAMELPGDALEKLKKKATASKEKPDLKPTGRTETISGYACAEYQGTFQGLDVTYWVTNDVPNQKAVLEQLGKLSGAGDPLQAALASGGDFPGFPIRTTIKSEQMGESTVTVVSIKEGAIAESEFQVPAGYKKMDVPVIPGR